MDQQIETRVQPWQWPDPAASETPQNGEPRYHLYPPARVTRLDDPEAELECLLTNISLTEVKILAGESLPENEIVVIELQDSLLLADVRYSLPRKSKFAIGASRMHTLQKVSLPRDATKIEMLEALVCDFHAQCASQIEKLQGTIHNLQIQPRKETAPSGAFELRVPQDSDGFKEARSPRPEPGVTGEADPYEVVLSYAAPQLPQKESQRKEESASEAAPSETARPKERSPRMKFGALAALLAVIGSAAWLAWWTDGTYAARSNSQLKAFQQASSRPSPKHVAAFVESTPPGSRISEPGPPLITPPVPAPPSPPAEALQIPSPAAAPVSSNLRHVSIKTTEESWIAVCSDGKEVAQKLLPAGGTREFDFSKKAILRMGNPRSVEITVDGTPIEPPGRKGDVSALELSPDGSRFLLPKDVIKAGGCGTRQAAHQNAHNVARTKPGRPEQMGSTDQQPSPWLPATQPQALGQVEAPVEPAQ